MCLLSELPGEQRLVNVRSYPNSGHGSGAFALAPANDSLPFG
jgi:hypothetical protein